MSSTKVRTILKQISSRRDTLLKEYPNLASQVQEIKSTTAANLKEYVKKATSSLKGKGCHVIFAKNSTEAQEQILKILAGHQSVAMSKNSVFTEIALREYLKSNNVEILDTDLGERVAGTKVEAHPWIASINTPISNKEWVAQIKNEIKQQAAHMQYGITGAEAIIEQNGTLALLESEGNVRFTSNLPYNHIVVAGIDKIVPSLEDALSVCRAISVYGLGRDILKYISFISGPSRTADIEFRMVQGMHGPKEVYVILLDNGRLATSENQQWDLLKCLHCGGCLVDCPKYLEEGLERGYYYSGKRANVLAAFLEGFKQAEDPDCGDCSLCNENCPAGIQV
ncbi:LUD domain-containing protein [Desulfosporosinus lacus]|uniref:L-lactate utilization protein LutB, contains a ferredoxin-type domain n=1 Tax=Desulfosporosinus lacus DSM 15449 TaxID=1121420 RepID=A0A1M6DWP2_9FIRM|nr:LUD domain-containing protein [Desulfosporosinus lacus]SHI77687.1 L-lactate utilization protein LutB, contains a ferredoxin-type domain [Desulfosporosinus lacus DSM 15449]